MPSIGEQFAGYRLKGVISQGVSSALYLAVELSSGRTVALKVMEMLPERRARFELLLGAGDPHVVPVYAVGEAGGLLYVAMRYIPGGDSLRTLLDRTGPLDLRVAQRILGSTADALTSLHERDLILLDLDPSKLLLSGEPASPDVLVTASGVAPPEPAGNLSYLAPELIAGGPGDVDARADVYAVGVILYEMLTGRVPFRRKADTANLEAQLLEPPSPTGLGPEVDAVIGRALAKRPIDRQRSAGQLAAELLSVGSARRLYASPLGGLVGRPFQPALEARSAEAELMSGLRRAVARGALPERFATQFEDGYEHEVRQRGATGGPSGDLAAAPAPQQAPSQTAAPAYGSPAQRPGAPPSPAGEYPLAAKSDRLRSPSLVARVAAIALPLAGLAAFAKYVLGWFVVPIEPPSQPPPTPEPPAPEQVDCTAFAPLKAAPGTEILVQVFVHLPLQADDARALATEFAPGAQRRQWKALEAPISRGDRIEIELSMPGAQIDDPRGSLLWDGRAQSVQFGVTLPRELAQQALTGTVAVSRNDVPIGHLKFQLAIDPAAPGGELEPVGNRTCNYKYAFISYASKDREDMLKVLQGFAVNGIRYFADVLTIEPGARWARRIEAGIDECDLFLLIWSKQAKASEWVKREVLHAQARQANDPDGPPEIRPIFVELPIELPWPDVGDLQFNSPLLHGAIAAPETPPAPDADR